MVRISVLLPVRDARAWLASSLASLARQTVSDHEVIAVDDGSSDGSGELLERAARQDARLVVRRTEPRGLPATLNLALSLARAPWIARHDADDVSHRLRFERQLAFAAAHPELDVIGTPESRGIQGKVLNIELSSPFGQAHFEAPAEAMSAFLQRTYQIVPAGQESRHIDIETELNDLLRNA